MCRRIAIYLILLTFFTACYRDHLYVQQEWVDRNFLASTKVGTPDPRQADPPEGQRILVGWRFSQNLLAEKLQLVLTVRFWDNSQEVIARPIQRSVSNTAFNFFDGLKILTYRIDVVNAKGDVIQTWEHQFWTKLIDIDRRSNSVSSHPRQGSVMETP